MNESIPIVLSSDNQYAIPLYVTFVSLMQSKKEQTKYQFYFLISDDFSEVCRSAINRWLEETDQPQAKWFDMRDSYQDAFVHVRHLTYAAYYRLQIPELLEDEKKCIYLDVDICVCQDLTELFEIDIEDDYIAGVRAAGYYVPADRIQRFLDTLEIDKFDRYINSGVMLMNLKKIREDQLAVRFDELVKKKFKSEDQDVLNSGCYPKIKVIEPKYNLMIKYPVLDIDDYERTECLKIAYTKDEWKQAIYNPVIVHYADYKKPWLYMDVAFAQTWWDAFSKAMAYVGEQASSLLDDFVQFYQLAQKRHGGKEQEFENRLNRAFDEKSEINAKLQRTYDEKSELGRLLQRTYDEKSELGKLLQRTYDEKSELGRLLQQTYDEKSEMGKLLQRTYDEKSEINKKLQITYDEKFERGVQIKELKKEKAKLEKQIKKLESKNSTLSEQKKELSKDLKQRTKDYDRVFAMYKNLEKRSIVCWIKKAIRKVKGKFITKK